ncbi:tetratricopeptide repeat protein [Paenibacillus koleovorans]|uniref:tetratricopeptide repeat protein n=1 Tax=Paenibacillus koleovorans TaxID=121608 RepID=UPI000FD8B8D5|nr:tetratricopeptide repeat protein [Paenibacillus koleovorans]
MMELLKKLWKPIAVLLVIFIAFSVNVWLGIGIIAAMLAYLLFVNRSAFYAQKGNRAYISGDMDQALVWMEKAYSTKPIRPQHQVGYGYLLLKTGDPVKAEKVLLEVEKNAKTRDSNIQVHLNLATAYWLQGRRDEAVAKLKQQFEDVKNSAVYGNLGYMLLLHGDLEEALAFNREAYEYNDSDITIVDNMAQTYYMLGRYEEAEDIYQKVMAKSPKHADSYYYYALTLHQLGKEEEAREQIGEALSRKPALITTLTQESLQGVATELGYEASVES